MVSQKTCTCDHKNGPELGTNVWRRAARLISYIHCTSEYKQYCHVGHTAQQCRLGLLQESDVAGDLEDFRNPRQVEHCAHLEVTHLFQQVGCARSRRVCHTAQPKLKLFLSMQDCGWTEFQRLIFGTCQFKYYIQIQIEYKSSSRNGETCLPAKHQRRNSATQNSQRRLELSHVDFVPSSAKYSHEGTK